MQSTKIMDCLYDHISNYLPPRSLQSTDRLLLCMPMTLLALSAKNVNIFIRHKAANNIQTDTQKHTDRQITVWIKTHHYTRQLIQYIRINVSRKPSKSLTRLFLTKLETLCKPSSVRKQETLSLSQTPKILYTALYKHLSKIRAFASDNAPFV